MGKRTWLEHLINNDYLPAISRLKNTPRGRKDAEKWADWMKQQWGQHGLQTLKQQQSLMDRTRRVIKDQLGEDHFALESMRFSTEEYVQINHEKQGVVSDRNEQVQFLDNPDAIVAQAARLLDSPEWSEVAAGLSVLTGRRSSYVARRFLTKNQPITNIETSAGDPPVSFRLLVLIQIANNPTRF